MKRLLLIIGLSLSFSGTAFGQMDKCGIAGYFLKDNSLLSSAGRFVINMTFWPSSTLGMTFGTSGCKQHTIVENDKEVLHYVTVAKHDLMIQMAQGSGQQMDAFSARLGCNWMSTPRFNQVLQRHYDGIFHKQDMEPSEIIERVRYYLDSDPKLVNECSAGMS